MLLACLSGCLRSFGPPRILAGYHANCLFRHATPGWFTVTRLVTFNYWLVTTVVGAAFAASVCYAWSSMPFQYWLIGTIAVTVIGHWLGLGYASWPFRHVVCLSSCLGRLGSPLLSSRFHAFMLAGLYWLILFFIAAIGWSLLC